MVIIWIFGNSTFGKSVSKNPHILVTDGLQAYKQAFTNEFYDNTRKDIPMHIHNAGIRDTGNNNVIERYHGTLRERDKVMRGFKSEETAKVTINGFRNYYNFIREHSELGTTPAEMAGLDLNLGRNRWMDLLRRSVGD